jgi:multicomponent K+:H+ antiporter subunit F
MIATALIIGFAAVGAALLLDLYRVVRGPELPDRVLGLDTLTYNAIALLMLAGLYFQQDSYFAAALVIAMLGFITTVALSLYLLRGEVIE